MGPKAQRTLNEVNDLARPAPDLGERPSDALGRTRDGGPRGARHAREALRRLARRLARRVLGLAGGLARARVVADAVEGRAARGAEDRAGEHCHLFFSVFVPERKGESRRVFVPDGAGVVRQLTDGDWVLG